MTSVSLRVALLKQADVHCKLATAQETPEGDAERAIEHYLTAMELLTCAVADLFQLSDTRKQPPKGCDNTNANNTQQRPPAFSSPLSEVYLHSVVQRKLAQYEERVRLLMEVVAESKEGEAAGADSSADGKGSFEDYNDSEGGKTAAAFAQYPAPPHVDQFPVPSSAYMYTGPRSSATAASVIRGNGSSASSGATATAAVTATTNTNAHFYDESPKTVIGSHRNTNSHTTATPTDTTTTPTEGAGGYPPSAHAADTAAPTSTYVPPSTEYDAAVKPTACSTSYNNDDTTTTNNSATSASTNGGSEAARPLVKEHDGGATAGDELTTTMKSTAANSTAANTYMHDDAVNLTHNTNNTTASTTNNTTIANNYYNEPSSTAILHYFQLPSTHSPPPPPSPPPCEESEGTKGGGEDEKKASYDYGHVAVGGSARQAEDTDFLPTPTPSVPAAAEAVAVVAPADAPLSAAIFSSSAATTMGMGQEGGEDKAQERNAGHSHFGNEERGEEEGEQQKQIQQEPPSVLRRFRSDGDADAAFEDVFNQFLSRKED